jgi:lysophospholipase L1-like esterase
LDGTGREDGWEWDSEGERGRIGMGERIVETAGMGNSKAEGSGRDVKTGDGWMRDAEGEGEPGMKPVRLYLASDSTCQQYDVGETKQAGWGMFIGGFLDPAAAVVNRAIGGRSSKSFIIEGRLDIIREELQPGDWLLIQLGHNDSTKEKPERYTDPGAEYRGYLEQYVNAARQRGAHPLLITPVARLHYEDGRFINDFPAYCRTMKELADEEKVPLVDLMELSLKHYADMGYDEVFHYYMISVNGTDCTHFTGKGALAAAKLLSDGIRELGVELSAYFNGCRPMSF